MSSFWLTYLYIKDNGTIRASTILYERKLLLIAYTSSFSLTHRKVFWRPSSSLIFAFMTLSLEEGFSTDSEKTSKVPGRLFPYHMILFIECFLERS